MNLNEDINKIISSSNMRFEFIKYSKSNHTYLKQMSKIKSNIKSIYSDEFVEEPKQLKKEEHKNFAKDYLMKGKRW